MRGWSFDLLEVSEGAFGCCKHFFDFLLHECVVDVKSYDLSLLSVERLI